MTSLREADSLATMAVSPAQQVEAHALTRSIRLAVQELPEVQRCVFALSEYENMSYKDIARVLDCPVGTVASRKRLAVEALRRRL